MKHIPLVGLAVATGLLLAACAPNAVTVTVTVEVPGPIQVVTATPPPVTPEPKKLVVCQAREPLTLYLYGMEEARHIHELIYDGPIDYPSYTYQPVILQKLPSLADGDAAIQPVTVREGDLVVDAQGEVEELTADLTFIRPAGCRAADCQVTFDGQPVELDQMVVTFRLVQGITWSDGEPLTAHDSVFSFQVMMDPDTPVLDRASGERTASYEATDDTTVVWTGLPGYVDPLYFTHFWSPLPEHQLGDLTPAEIADSAEASQTPLGWGPFIITEWVPGDYIRAVRNPNYFRASEGLPYLDEVEFRFVGQDPNAAIAALLNGECDVLTQDLHLEEQLDLLVALEARGQVVPTFAGKSWEHVDFGVDPAEGYTAPRPDFGDVRMRRAIAYCLNRQAVVDTLFHGRSVVLHSFLPPEHPLYNPDVVQYDYDPGRGMALLEQMGWTDADFDGVREANGIEGVTNGTPLAFTWSSSTKPERVAAMRMFQADLAACGFYVTLENLPPEEWHAEGPEGPLFGRQFDLGQFAWLTSFPQPCAFYLCSEVPSAETHWMGLNVSGYCNPDYDAACEAALQALPGTERYEVYYQEAQRIFAEDLPALPLFLQPTLAAHRAGVTGFAVDPTEPSELWNVESFDIY